MDLDSDSFRQHLEQRVGRTLCGRYTLEGLIGIGGMASVYRGTHRNGNRVAVKVLHTELCLSKDIRDRFLREGYVANSVDHPGAVRVLDDDVTEDGAVFLVMELLEGETIESLLLKGEGSLSARELIPLVCQLLDVLGAAHAKGIVHRDIKPENVFVQQRDKSVKVLDFGIARLNDGGVQATRTGRVMGTPVYMAPEQARGETKRVDGRTDLWAVGAILFRGLTGRYVHEADTPEMVMIHAATRPAPRLRDVLPSIESQIAEIVDRALQTANEDRWRTAEAMATALRGLRPEEMSSTPAQLAALAKTLDMTKPMSDGVSADTPQGRTERVVAAVPQRGAGFSNFSFDEDTEMTAPIAQAYVPPPRPPSTNAGVARSNPVAVPGAPHPPRATRLIVPASLLVLLGVGLGTFAVFGRSSDSPTAVGSANGPSVSEASAASTATASSASTTARPSDTPPTDGPSPIAVSALPAQRPAPAVVVAQPAPTVRFLPLASASVGSATPLTPAPPVAAAPAPAASVCAPKKSLTADGTWQWRMECTKK